MDNKPKTAPRARSYVGLTLAILVLVAAAAGGLAIVNKGLTQEVADKTAAVNDLDKKIAALQANRNIVLSGIIRAGQADVNKAVASSRVQDYVDALAAVSAKYGVSFEGFAFQGGRVSTTVVALGDDKSVAIRKLQGLVKDARDNAGLALTLSGGTSVALDLEKIAYVTGDDARRVASVTFDVK